MTLPVTVVGAGAAAVHFALSVLERGGRVLMLDTGRTGAPQPHPDASFPGLKERLDDPERWFLGEDFGGAVLPGGSGEFYGLPPSKDHVFAEVPHFRFHRDGFEPLLSFARGGLAEAWTGGCYPFGPEELAAFPVPRDAFARAYDRVAARIGVTGEADDLERFMPLHENLLPPLDLDEHSRVLLGRYRARRPRLHASGAYLGRSRIAVLSRDLGDRRACDYRGRCLWGCPRDALYTPSATLRECLRRPGFEYRPGLFVSHFVRDGAGRIGAVFARPLGGGPEREIPVGELVLAAGTIGTARILLESVRRATGELVRLPGLMDNRQILLPFVSWRMIGRPPEYETYQYHQIAVGLAGRDPADDLHGQITTLKSGLVHPVIQGLPFDLRTGLGLFRGLHAALGLLNLNRGDTRREECHVQLDPDRPAPDGSPGIVLRYRPPEGEPAKLRDAIRRARRMLRALGAFVPPGMVHLRPMGASIHYAGTVPMTAAPRPWTVAPDGRCRGFPNLTIVDGSVFPALSAKQLTFTMMANAARIGDAFPSGGGAA